LPDKPSIAVLPFNDLSPNRDQESFSDGMAEEILNALARFDPGPFTARKAVEIVHQERSYPAA